MHPLFPKSGPIDYSETSRENRNPATANGGWSDALKKLIRQANAVPIIFIFRHYGLHFDNYARKIICPFKSHKNGRESSPSFWYYPESNSYHCYGCLNGNRGVDFVAEMERCTPEQAANKILEQFAKDVDQDLLAETFNPSERLETMMQFANRVYDFYQSNSGDHASQFIEYICWVYDRHNQEHKLDNEALQRLVNNCIDHIDAYHPDLILTMETGDAK